MDNRKFRVLSSEFRVHPLVIHLVLGTRYSVPGIRHSPLATRNSKLAAGFTLIELLVAFAFLAVVLTALLHSVRVGLRNVGESEALFQAAQQAELSDVFRQRQVSRGGLEPVMTEPIVVQSQTVDVRTDDREQPYRFYLYR